MPALWSRFGNDGASLVVAFLLVVAVPAHAFVLGFDRSRVTGTNALDTALLKRVGVWLAAAAVAMVVARGLLA